MYALRQICIDLLATTPDEDLSQVLETLKGIIEYNKEAAAYVPPSREPDANVTMKVTPNYLKPSPIVIDVDDDE